MGKILVKAPQIQLGPNGPQMFYNVGVGGGGRGSSGVRGRTKRSRVGGALGGAVGVLGGLAGESRSLGGLLSNVQVGAMQGSAVGRGLANMATLRRRQARADLEEQGKDDYAKQRAQADFEYRQQNPSLATRMNPMNINRRRFEAEQGRLQQAKQTNLNTQQLGQELAEQDTALGRARLAVDKREAKDRKMKLEEYRQQKPALALASSMNEQQINAFNQMLNTAPRLGDVQQQPQPQQQLQVPQSPIPPPEHGAASQSDAKVNAEGTGTQAFQTHTNASTENAEQEVQEMQGGDGEEGGEEDQSTVRSGPGFGRQGLAGMDDKLFNTSGGRQ